MTSSSDFEPGTCPRLQLPKQQKVSYQYQVIKHFNESPTEFVFPLVSSSGNRYVNSTFVKVTNMEGYGMS